MNLYGSPIESSYWLVSQYGELKKAETNYTSKPLSDTELKKLIHEEITNTKYDLPQKFNDYNYKSKYKESEVKEHNFDSSSFMQQRAPATQNLSYFAKSETSVSMEDNSVSNYSGVGAKYPIGNRSISGFIAGKTTEDTNGCFVEGKYTTKAIPDWDCSQELRLRYFTNWEKDGGKPQHSLNLRGSLGYSEKFNDFSVYFRGGVSTNVSLHGDGIQSVGPMALAGVEYKISDNCAIYGEIETSRAYDIQNSKWKDYVAPSLNLGVNYNF